MQASGIARMRHRSDLITKTPSASDEHAIVTTLAKRLFPHSDAATISRVRAGVSTRVYCIPQGAESFYLRVLPEAGASFAPEVYAHALLCERGVKAPAVIYWEHRNPDLDLSIMITTEIKGEPLGRAASMLSAADMRLVLNEAGRDLALINDMPVDGFGWIRRDAHHVTRLVAEHESFRAFAHESLDADLELLREAPALSATEVETMRQTLSRLDAMLGVPQGRLAHGDLDVSHIYVADGRYSGIIDFGEIRGADPLYDLAHFKLHDGETLPLGLLPHLVKGYAAGRPLPADYLERLSLLALLIAIHALARRLRKRPFDAGARHFLAAIRKEIAFLRASPP